MIIRVKKKEVGYKMRFEKYFASFSPEQKFIVDAFVKMELRRFYYVKLKKSK